MKRLGEILEIKRSVDVLRRNGIAENCALCRKEPTGTVPASFLCSPSPVLFTLVVARL